MAVVQQTLPKYVDFLGFAELARAVRPRLQVLVQCPDGEMARLIHLAVALPYAAIHTLKVSIANLSRRISTGRRYGDNEEKAGCDAAAK